MDWITNDRNTCKGIRKQKSQDQNRIESETVMSQETKK
jgi:hypothetical protein